MCKLVLYFMIPHISPRVEINCDEARLHHLLPQRSSGKQKVSLKTFFLQILTLNNLITNESIMLDVSRRSPPYWSWLHRPWTGFQMVWNQSNPTSVTGFVLPNAADFHICLENSSYPPRHSFKHKTTLQDNLLPINVHFSQGKSVTSHTSHVIFVMLRSCNFSQVV